MGNDDRAADVTEAVISLQERVQGFQKDAKRGRQNFVLKPPNQNAPEESSPVVLGLVSVDEEVKAQLQVLEKQLSALETQLRLRGHWYPSTRIQSNAEKPTILDISDLSNAVHLLTRIITVTQSPRQLTPQPSFSSYEWHWDPAWHEYYTCTSSSQTYIYLSRWRLNKIRNVWEHVSMAGGNLMPDTAAELLGAWEDWEFDPIWGDWCLKLDGEKEEDAGCYLFASKWQVQADGEWVFVGRVSGAWE
jgi:hypothetical protein